MANDLLVRILGDSRSLERAFARSSKSASTFGKDMDRSSRKFATFAKGTAAGLGIGIGLAGVTRGLQGVVSEASNLNEQMSRTQQVFEQSSDAVVAWSRTTDKSMGIAQSAALEAAGTFGAMFDQAGQSSAEAARLSETVVQLAADLASFNNTTVDEALTALRSGLSGEIEPLRRFQVFLTEAAVSQRAMADSGKENVKQLTQGEKILARYRLILEQTGKQQGDFERTAGSLANQQRILNAQWKNAQAELGQNLLPAMIKVTEGLNAMVGALDNTADATLLLSKRFRDDLSDAFGVEFVREALADAGPELDRAMKDFEASIDPFDITVPINIRPKPTTTVDPADFAKLPGVDFGFDKSIIGAVDKATEVARKQIAEALAKGRAARRKDAAERAADARKDAAEARRIAAERAAEIRREALEARRAALQAAQFRALGLAPGGGEIVPGVENLRKQLASLTDRLAGSDVQSKLVNRLAGVGRLLKGEFGKVTETTRAAINDLFSTIREEFDQGVKDGPLTKTTTINSGKILEGLGLGRDLEKELRARLSSFNSAGVAVAGARTTPTGTFRGGIVVENHNTINLDGDTVARNVTKSQQSTRRRNPTQKRGRRSGI